MIEYQLQVGLTYNDYKKKMSYKNGLKVATKILNKFVSGYTIIKCIGYWNSKKEKSIQIKIASDITIDFLIDEIIKQLCNELKQNCIMLTKQIKNISFKGSL